MTPVTAPERGERPGFEVPRSVRVRVFAEPRAASAAALAELERTLQEESDPLVSFATGATFAEFFAEVAKRFASGRLGPQAFRATHLDEYLGFAPDRRGGMVDELRRACPPLRAMLEVGRLLPVPSSGSEDSLRAHEHAIAALGGVALQFLGIGRNGHLAFNEPGTSFDLGFHRALLAESTRADARERFAPDEPPREAVTAGPRNIVEARRVVLVARGAHKAEAVRAMLTAPIGPACPATLLRRHRDALVLLDRAAAARLEGLAVG